MAAPVVAARLARRPSLAQVRAALLIAPLALFLALAFLTPIAWILTFGVKDGELAQTWPETAAVLREEDGSGIPGEPVFAALARDMRASHEARTTAAAARRLNYALPGGRTLVMGTTRRIADLAEPPADGTWRDAFTSLDPAWGEPQTWVALRQASGPASAFYLLQAVDLQRGTDGSLEPAPEESRIYLQVLGRTFQIAGVVVVVTLLMGFPVAYTLAHAPPPWNGVAMVLVLLPLWTSLLVRTGAWVVLLQDQGLVNGALIGLGITDEPLRLIFNRTGLVIAMVHVSLPYMILPIYATMATIAPDTMRAARSLGAPATYAFRRVYLPQTLPGVAAGVLLVFIMALGYYITPALVGGADDQLISYFIAFYTTDTVNWGMAGALAIVLVAATTVLYGLYVRLTGSGGVSLG